MAVDSRLGALVELATGRHLDRSSVTAQVTRRARILARRGLGRGDRIFIHYGNNSAFFIDLLAAWWIGACVVPIDARLTAFEIETLARAARPRFCLLEDSADQELSARLAETGAMPLRHDEEDGGGDASVPPSPQHLDDPALILFTSGTTGDPKGVVHSHRSLQARFTSLRQVLGIDPYRRTLCLLPTHFGHGLICNCLFPWFHGADLYIVPPFRAEMITELGRLIDEHQITFLSSVPTVWTLALKMAKPPRGGSLKRVHCGSAPLSAHMWSGVQEWSGTREVFNTYGITETASWVAGTTMPSFVPEDGLIGEGWGALIRILKSGSTNTPPMAAEPCAPGEQGYVWLGTPALMTGYFEREDLTANVVSQGWFMTGDIGLLDERGFLYLRGREREEINKGGMKIYPGDIDSVATQFPAVSDVCTFAVEDPLYGQDVGIALVIKDEPDKTLEALRAFLGTRLAKHQMPARWYVVEAIPRTSRGKINRAHVAASCSQAARYPFKSAGA